VARVVVGVDGSECSQRALNWAAEAAELRGARLEVVYTYEPVPGVEIVGSAARVGELSSAAELEARALVATMLDAIEADDDLRTEGHAIPGVDPARTLVERSEGADLLVVGSRGRGALRSVLLGSVSHTCVHHAGCPVVIVR
jgi:nucleotide-binding universal stress UspA family protein